MSEARHILVVDDDRRIRELIKSYLMENGFLVSMAGTAAEARERMRGLTFDLLVLDIMMPGETGLSFTKSLRSERRDVPILMLSALADTDDRIAGLATGSDDYLAKPFEPRELLLRIKIFCAGRALPPAPKPMFALAVSVQCAARRASQRRRSGAPHLR